MRCFTLTCALASIFSLTITADSPAQAPNPAGYPNPYAGGGSQYQQPSPYQQPTAYQQASPYQQPSAYQQASPYQAGSGQPQAVPQQFPLPTQQQPMAPAAQGRPVPSAYSQNPYASSGYGQSSPYGQTATASDCPGGACSGPACACGMNHGPATAGMTSGYYAPRQHAGQPLPYQWASQQGQRWEDQRQAAYDMSHIPPEARGQLPAGYSVAHRESDVQLAGFNSAVSRTPPQIPGSSIGQMQQEQAQVGDKVAKKPSIMQRVKKFIWPF